MESEIAAKTEKLLRAIAHGDMAAILAAKNFYGVGSDGFVPLNMKVGNVC